MPVIRWILFFPSINAYTMRWVRGHACICPGSTSFVRRGISEVPTTGKPPVTGLTTGVLPVVEPLGESLPEGVLMNGSVIDILSQEGDCVLRLGEDSCRGGSGSRRNV